MSNHEILKNMDTDTFTDAILALLDTPFKASIDWHEFMKGDKNPTDYLPKEKVVVLPSDAEVAAALGRDALNDKAKCADYISKHSVVMPVLGRSTMYGNGMVTVADVQNGRIMKVPERFTKPYEEVGA